MESSSSSESVGDIRGSIKGHVDLTESGSGGGSAFAAPTQKKSQYELGTGDSFSGISEASALPL